MEDGRWTAVREGTPQGSSISPLLANLYLHHVLDLWVQLWRKRQAHGDVVIVRWADDFIVGFQHRKDAEQFVEDLRARLGRFALELHPEKTRLIEFGRYAAQRRRGHGLGKPETFDFLGFTHICAKSQRGTFLLKRRTMRQRMRAKLGEVKQDLRRRWHQTIPEQGRWLGARRRPHGRLLAPGLTALDLELPEDFTKRSPAAVAWKAFNRTLDDHFERALLAA